MELINVTDMLQDQKKKIWSPSSNLLNLHISPIGLVTKAERKRKLATHIPSWNKGINPYINPANTSVHFHSFDQAVETVSSGEKGSYSVPYWAKWKLKANFGC